MPYASYQELAAHPQVLKTIQEHVETVNRDLSQDPRLSGSQIRRFIVLHKELDADDGELTRTRKVRRGFVADKYQNLVEALYSGQNEIYIETGMTFEDGRKGTLKANLQVLEAETFGEREPLKMAV